MKTTLLFLFIGFTLLPLKAQEKQEPEAGSIERAITDAIRLSHLVENGNDERIQLRFLADKPKHRLSSSQAARLKILEKDLSTSISANLKVISKLQVGESVFSYPGLLALAQVSYNPDKRTYSVKLLEGFSYYEDGTIPHPVYRVVTFNETGRITDIHRIRTADMVTK